jgi:type II secretory pathway component GspD/PulD (secretin)
MLKGSWMRKRWKHGLVTVTAVCALLLTGAGVWAAGESSAAGTPRSRVYKFRHITSRQAQDMLTQLKIGSGYNALTSDVLIVTGRSGPDLIKASGVLTLLDRKEPVSVRTLMVGTEAQPLPHLDVFVAKLKTVAAGTLLEGPSSSDKPAIVDIVDNKLIAIASTGVLDEIEAALNEWQNAQAKAAQRASAAAKAEAQPKPAVEQPDAEVRAADPKLADVASELFGRLEQETQTPDPREPAAEVEAVWDPMESLVQNAPVETAMTGDETTDEAADSFIEDELLKVLADAENKARQQQEAAAQAAAAQAAAEQAALAKAAADKAAAEQRKAAVQEPPADLPDPDSRPDDNLLKMLALLGQSQPQAQEPAPSTEQTGHDPTAAQPQAQAEPAPLKAELDGLRQQLARLEQMLAQGQTAGSSVPPISAPVVNIDSTLSEKELETVMDLPQEIQLESLVDLVGKQLGLNYMYEKNLFANQTVQLKVHGGKIKVGEMYGLLESVLRFRGFVMTRRNGLVTILKVQDAPAKAEPLIRDPDEPIPPGEIIVSTVFHLSHIDVNNAEAMLRGMNLGSNFTKIGETNTLIVTDYAYRMSQIRQVLEMIDVKGELKEYKFRTLKYLKPSELVPKLRELAGQLQGVNLQINTGAAATPTTRTVQTRDPRTGRTITQQVPVTTATPSAGGTAQADAVFIDTDDRTNRVLVAGKAAQIELINELIDALDVPQYDLKYVREYIIQYVEAGEVVNVLNGLGLASVNVSTQAGSTQQTGRVSAAQARAQAQAQGQPPQPQPQVVQSAAQVGSSEQPYISIRPATNSLLVNATAEQHKSIELVIAHVDVIQKDQRTIRQYEIQHVDTQEIIDTLGNLGIIMPSSQTSTASSRTAASAQTARTGRTPQPQQIMNPEGGMVPMSLPTADGGSEIDVTADQPQIAVLRATNSLLVYATPRQHDAIALVIAHADRVPEVASTPYVIYALENQDPLKLSEVLNKLIDQTVDAAARQSSPDSKVQVSGAAQSASPNIPTLEEERIRIIPDEESYSLIVFANKRNQQWVSEMIRELDQYRPQVLLDCTLVEITKDDAFQYKIDMIAKTYGGSELQPGTPIGTPAKPFGGDFSTSRALGDASTIAGNITAFLNTGSVQAILTAMQKDGFGRVMSQPKLLVNDNQEGEIKSERKTSIAQKKTVVQPGSTPGQTITSEDVSFNEYTSGVTLKIKPHISKGDMLRLEIELVRSDFKEQDPVSIGNSGEFPRPPDILSTNVTSVATVPDGTTIVLGGLERVTQNKSHSKVPILGDIPLVGALFRSVNDTDGQSKLYVFVKANIIRPGDQAGGLKDIRRVSKKYRDEFEKMERKFQGQDAIPGIKGKPMDPLRVLEMDEIDRDHDDDEYDRIDELVGLN